MATESDFSAEFNDLRAKQIAVVQMLVDEFPAAAVRAKEIISGAPAQAEIDAEVQADNARANAIKQLKSEAWQVLDSVVTPDPPADPPA